ncbi:MAG: hypothetical protein SGI83_17720 [Bacteroidota bacterium]|nr:hypothetical protein [Bacteroidota bacterium]
MRKIVLTTTALFFYTMILSQTRVDSLIMKFDNYLSSVCKGVLNTKTEFIEYKVIEDETSVGKINTYLTGKFSFKSCKRYFKNSKATHYSQLYKKGEMKFLVFYFEGNYIKGEVLFSFQKRALVQSGAKIQTFYPMFCDDYNLNSGLIDLEFAKKHILPKVSPDIIVSIDFNLVLGRYVDILSEVSSLKGKDF